MPKQRGCTIAALCTGFANTARKHEALQHLRRAVELAPDDLGCRKMLDRIQGTSSLVLRLRAFRGSWGCLSVLGLLGAISLTMVFVAIGQGELRMMAGMLVNVTFWGGLAYLYWRLKSR